MIKSYPDDGPAHPGLSYIALARLLPACSVSTALLMDAAEQLARDRDIATPLDGRDERPHSKGSQVTMDDDLIIWLTKDLIS